MLSFYLIAGGLALVAAILMVRPLLAGRSAAPAQANTDAQVFRDQLAEIDRDLERGTINPTEAEGARIEVSRRLLAADARAQASGDLKPAPQGHSGMVAGLALIGAPALAAALYLAVGSPGQPDSPFAERQGLPAVLEEIAALTPRPSQAEAEARAQQTPQAQPQVDAEYRAMVAQLEQTVADRPDDLQGHTLLGNALMQLGRWPEAAEIYARAIELAGDAVDPDLFGNRAEALILSAGGYVSPEAERVLAEALRRDPRADIARYYAGLAVRQAGRLEEAIRIWQSLRVEAPQDAPYLQYLDLLLAETVQAVRGAGGQSGPSQAEIDAAQEMSPEDRMAMIETMIGQLESRLMIDGGSPQEWGQLIASYATLNRAAEARSALDLALIAYPEGAAHDALIRHGQNLGLIEVTAPVAGPSEADIEAAQEMSPEDRRAMIEGMVGGLEERLTEDGGTAEEWLRLITSYARLGRMEDANRIYRLAETALAERSDPARGWVKEQSLVLGVDVE
ncbi:MAG: c-type cytochrome biogenesis protein CcmI [Pseudomonadota bacterium]